MRRWLLILLLLSLPAMGQITAASFGEHEHNIPVNSWPSVTIGAIRTNGDLVLSTGNVDWPQLETCRAASSSPSDGCFAFNPNLKGWLDLVVPHGVDLLITISNIPTWSNGGANNSDLPLDAGTTDSDFSTFTAALFTYIRTTYGYSGNLAFGCGNEPNDSPAQFWNAITPNADTKKTNVGHMCKDAYNNAKAVDSSILVGTPEPQGTALDSWMDTYFTDIASECTGVGNGICADFVSAHFYLGRSNGIATATINNAGTGYTVGDILTVTQAGGSLGKLRVSSVSSGAIAGLQIYNYGAGYATGSALSVTGGSGSGATVNITATSFDNLPETTATLVEALKTVMSNHGVSALPIWDTENGFGKVAFWPNTDLEAYFAAAQTIMAFAHGVVRTYKYSWSGDPVGQPTSAFGFFYNKGTSSYTAHGTSCLAKTSCIAATAYQSIQGWLIGSTFNDQCSLASSIETCNLTLASGAPAKIVWDTSKSCVDDPASCDTSTYAPGASYLTVKKLDGTSTSIVGNSVALGIKPLMVVGTVPSSGNSWGGLNTLKGTAVIH